MSDKTKIEWTDATWNPITGCSVVSGGCKHCYAMKLAGTRLKHHPSRENLTVNTKEGPVWSGQVRFNEKWLNQPISWQNPRRIFVCAHGDLFHENVPDEWIDKLFVVMALSPQHTFQILTKRPERMRQYITSTNFDRMLSRFGSPPEGLFNINRHTLDARLTGKYEGAYKFTPPSWPLPNVWLGVSVENQATADERIIPLLHTPAAVRWVSAEPLLGPVRLWLLGKGDYEKHSCGEEVYALSGIRAIPDCDWQSTKIDWVVVGGESGKGSRPMHPGWARSLRDQCKNAGTSFLFKQWGEWEETSPAGGADLGGDMRADRVRIVKHQGENDGHFSKGDALMKRVGKKMAGRLLDGQIHDNFPDNPGEFE